MKRVLCSIVGVCAILASGVSMASEQPAAPARQVLVVLQPRPSVQTSPSDIVNPRAVQKPTQKPVQKSVQTGSTGCCKQRLLRRSRLLGRR